jgi:hypothetical protein
MESGSSFTTDLKALIKIAEYFNSELHQIPSGFHTDDIHTLGEVNELHNRFKSWLVQFQGNYIGLRY